MKMEPTVSSETSAIRTQTPGNYPKKEQITLYQEVCKIFFGLYHLKIWDFTYFEFKNFALYPRVFCVLKGWELWPPVGTVINGVEPSGSAARELNSKIDHSEIFSDDGWLMQPAHDHVKFWAVVLVMLKC